MILYILGAGGHVRVAADIAKALGRYAPYYFVMIHRKMGHTLIYPLGAVWQEMYPSEKAVLLGAGL